MSTYTWIESPAWQLSFFGLPNRIPWPANAPQPDSANEQFDLASLIRGVEACMGSEPELIGPWRGFLSAAQHFGGMTEALEDQEYARASELLSEIEKDYPGSPYGLFHRAYVHRQSGNDEEAVRLYADAAQKAPGVGFIWNNLGTMLAENGNPQQAVQAFMNAVRINPNDRVALESLAQLKAVVKMLRDQNDPNSVVFVPVDQFRQMAGAQIEALSKNPDQLMQFGEAMIRDGIVPDIGVKALEKADEVRPNHPRTIIALGAGYRVTGEFDKARQVLARFNELQPNDPWGFFNLAQTCNAAKDAEGEKAAIEKTLAIDPNIQAALGVYFDLDNNRNEAKEKEMADYADKRGAWMPLLLSSGLARQRGDIPAAVGYAARAYERNPKSEEVLLQYCAMLGDAKDAEALDTVIKPAVTGGRFSKRLDWNYAQSLKQVGKNAEAIEVLRRALLGDAPEDFKAAAGAAIEFWSGLRAQSGELLEVHPSGQLTRPVLLTLEEGEGGVIIPPRQFLPAQGKFPWNARENGGTEARVRLQQGQAGLGAAPRPLGVFVVKNITPATEGPTNIDCRVEAMPDGRLLFSAGQDGRMLPVEWAGLA
ncbi:MAG: tetratricopeptide repeat protein [Chthoniobacteraceae bacterium]